MRQKVAVIGAGNVGATCAQRILERNLADVALVDVVEGLAQGKALDLSEATPLEFHDRKIIGSHTHEIISGSQVVVVTAGLARKPGMSRSDLLEANANILKSIIPHIVTYAPNAILIVVTNPLDVMTYLAWKLTSWPSSRVLGMAGVLDSARFRYFVADCLKVSVKEVQAMVLGGHGEGMVPLPRFTTVGGIPITELLSAPEIERLVQRTRDGGAEIVKLLKAGSAFYAPASSAADMVQAILRDEHRVLPACVYCDGPYNLREVTCGLPIRLGAQGVEEIVELPLTPAEKTALATSAQGVRKELDVIDSLVGSKSRG